MFRVLIVEDDLILAHQIAQLFLSLGAISTTHSIEETELWLEKHRADVIVMDRGLPDGDALELISYLRECTPATRLLILTNRAAVEERIRGLHEGADDYLPKPFEPRELLLRVQRLLYLERTPNNAWLHLGILQFNRSTGEAFVKNHPVHLRPREAQILDCLLKFKNRVVTRETIINRVWGLAEPPSTATLDVYLRRLRMLLGEAAHYIQTARGFGYLIHEPKETYT